MNKAITSAQDGYLAALAAGADVNLVPEEDYWSLRDMGFVDDGLLTEAGRKRAAKAASPTPL